MGHADLPEELADLLRPLRRRATLGPVAALNCDRREFALRDDHGTTLALLRDDKVTVRRGGLTTARYREVMITPVGPGITDEQAAWLDRAFIQAGATYVPRFPRLVVRLGAPATGPTDLPVPEPFDADVPFKKFVSQLLALRLRRIVEADLAIRGGDLTAVGRLADEAARLRDELEGLRRCWTRSGWRTCTTSWAGSAWTPAPSDDGRPGPAGQPAAQRALPDRAGAAGRGGAGAEAGRGPGRADRGDARASWSRRACDRLRAAADRLDRRRVRRGLGRGLAGDRAAAVGAGRAGPGGARGPARICAPARPRRPGCWRRCTTTGPRGRPRC